MPQFHRHCWYDLSLVLQCLLYDLYRGATVVVLRTTDVITSNEEKLKYILQ